jgi:serine/threonine protein kinase
VFGRYLLVQRLSRGGMGEIFLAKHGLAGFEKLAVIKKVLPHLAADEQFISRFVDEAQVAIKLSHVNVAQVFEVGRVGDEYFLALEYIDGRDLRRTLGLLGHRRARMPVDLALFIARELANGLAYAHRRTTSDGASLGLVHCDISPPNVLVSFEGETKVIDFGIAKSAMRGTTTDPKIGFGKFGYMAPEQLLRGGAVDHRTDLYAAGVVLYELLTGTRLYEAGPQPDYRALARKVTRGDHALPSEIDPVLAPYDDLVATALRPAPEDRYQSAAELRDAIQQCLVAVNPTISTDRLGEYMRELFAGEMNDQRALHARVASAHLSDFEEQLHTQTISTVSFAQAQLPLQPPESTGKVLRVRQTQPPASRGRTTGPSPADGTRTTGPSPAVGPPSILDTRTPPTEPLEPVPVDDVGPADTILGMAEQPGTSGRPRRWLVISASVAIMALAGIGLWRFMSSHGEPAMPPAPRGGLAIAPQAVRAEPPPVDPAPAKAAPDEIEMAPDEPGPGPGSGTAPPSVAVPPHHHLPRNPAHLSAHKDARPPAAPPPTALTREQLGQKFQQIRREYDDYKARFGSRLEREWAELTTYIQYMPAGDDDTRHKEAARRLDAFRSLMRE